MIEVVALHNHVVELQEGKTFFHTLFVALCTEHVVDAEACTYLTEQFYIVQVQQPVCVVEHHSFSLAELDETLHLTFEALCVVVDLLAGQHFSVLPDGSPIMVVPPPIRAIGLFPAICIRFIRVSAMK